MMADAAKTIGTVFSPAYALGNALFGKKKKDPGQNPMIDPATQEQQRLARERKIMRESIYAKSL
jgi:hypothetical protein